jgi:hypothetical protein
MAEYILDLSNVDPADIPSFWPVTEPKIWPQVLPLRDGRYYSKYDVIEEELSGFRGQVSLKLKRYFPEIYKRLVPCIPYGITYIPPGAKLHKRSN